MARRRVRVPDPDEAMDDESARAGVARGARLVRDGRRIVGARRAHPEAVHLLRGAGRPRDLGLADATRGFALGTEPFAFRVLRLAIRLTLGFAARALLFLRL